MARLRVDIGDNPSGGVGPRTEEGRKVNQLINLYNLIARKPLWSLSVVLVLWFGTVAVMGFLPEPTPVEKSAIVSIKRELSREASQLGSSTISLSQFTLDQKVVLASIADGKAVPVPGFSQLVPLAESSYGRWHKANAAGQCWLYQTASEPIGTLLWAGMTATKGDALYACPVYWPGTQDDPLLFGSVAVSFSDGVRPTSQVYPALVRLANRLSRYVPDL